MTLENAEKTAERIHKFFDDNLVALWHTCYAWSEYFCFYTTRLKSTTGISVHMKLKSVEVKELKDEGFVIRDMDSKTALRFSKFHGIVFESELISVQVYNPYEKRGL